MGVTTTAATQTSGNPGYLTLLRGQPFAGYDPAKYGPLWNYRLFPSRAGDAGTILFQYIYDRTWSARGCPEWAAIPLEEFCEYLPHKIPRAIRERLDWLEARHFIERDPNQPPAPRSPMNYKDLFILFLFILFLVEIGVKT